MPASNDATPARSSPSRARRALRFVGRAVLVVVALVGLAVAWLVHDLDARLRAALEAARPEIEGRIGRHVTYADVHASLGRTTELVLREVVIEAEAGATGEQARPLLKVPVAHVEVALVPLLRSLGKTVEIYRFALEGPEITVVRTATGLSIDDVRARLAAAPSRPPAGIHVAVARLSITQAKLHLLVQGGAPESALVVDPITIDGADLRLDAASRVTLQAAALSPTANVDVGVDLVPPPPGSTSSAPTTLQRLSLHLDGLPIAPILAFGRVSQARGVDLDHAKVTLDAVIEPGPLLAIQAHGDVMGARLTREDAEGARSSGAPTSLSFAADLSLDPAAGALTARSFTVGLGEAKATGSAAAHGLGAAPVVDSFELKASAEASALLPLLPPGSVPAALALEGPITLAIKGGGDPEQAHGTFAIDVARASVTTGGAGKPTATPPLAIHLGAELRFTRKEGLLAVSALDARAGELSATGGVEVRGLGVAPSIASSALTFTGPGELLLAMLPPARRPPGVALKGPLTATVRAHGDAADLVASVAVDLARASVRAPGFTKPAGVALDLALDGHGSKAGGTLAHATLTLGPMKVTAHGDVKGPGQLDLAFEVKGGAIERLIALFPAATERLGRTTTLEGTIGAIGTIRRAGGKTQVTATARVQAARIRSGLVLLTGAPELKVQLSAGKDALALDADADLGAASLVLAGVFTKPAGKPSRAALRLGRQGDQIQIRDARVLVPGLAFEGLDVTADPRHVHVVAPALTLTMAALTEAMPLLQGRIPAAIADATIRFGVELDLDPKDLAAATLHFKGVEVTGAVGHVTLALDVDGLPTPRAVRFQVLGGDLDLTGGGGRDEPIDVPDPGPIAVSGQVHLDRVRSHGQEVRSLDAVLALDHGRVLLDRLHAEALGGTIDLDKSWIDLTDVPELDLHGKVTDLDLSLIPGAEKRALHGRGTARVDVHGRGLGREALLRSLGGTARVALRDVEGIGHFDHRFTVVNPLLTRLAERLRKKQAGRERQVHLREATAVFAVGGNKLTLTEPTVIRADSYVATLNGSVSYDGAPLLDGQIDIAAEAIASATKGWLVPLRPIPLRLKLTGDAKELKVELIELGESLAALAGARESAVDDNPSPPP